MTQFFAVFNPWTKTGLGTELFLITNLSWGAFLVGSFRTRRLEVFFDGARIQSPRGWSSDHLRKEVDIHVGLVGVNKKDPNMETRIS